MTAKPGLLHLNVRTINLHNANAGQQLVRSLHETGFAVLENHPIPSALLKRIYAGWHQFFSSEEKHQFLFDPDDTSTNQAGLHPQHVSETAIGHSTKDIKEFFHLVPNARIPPELKDDALEYRELVMQLGHALFGWLQSNTPPEVSDGFSQPLPEALSSTMSLLRILHYPPLTGRENRLAERAAAHEDINFLTILPVADQPGLQVKDAAGKWLDVASSYSNLIVNTGDMLREASHGYFPSTTHRVVNPADDSGNVSRLSIPFFLAPHKEFVLSARYTADSYLRERLQLIGR